MTLFGFKWKTTLALLTVSLVVVGLGMTGLIPATLWNLALSSVGIIVIVEGFVLLMRGHFALMRSVYRGSRTWPRLLRKLTGVDGLNALYGAKRDDK